MLLVEFIQPGTTINADSYCETLRRLQRAIQNKQRGMMTSGIGLIHDNARPQSTRVTQQLLQQFEWDIFENPPYSPDLAPSDFNLFPELKQWLEGQHFQNDVELKKRSQLTPIIAGTFMKKVLQSCSQIWQMLLNRQGDCVEK
ncbi:histone-lysine N-methyltransferase SETMAR-like [Stegodyphus dumicola]|uniref:histone-lysine N-methyltransferase SETMAR-like n=1 Tax=Stegodyphus dumicola TaxID=202533 RepID=UPI0015AD6FC0|nr:histone-lysine N-methyltransferase SETMAR-like [Stegodyphus dumicola]